MVGEHKRCERCGLPNDYADAFADEPLAVMECVVDALIEGMDVLARRASTSPRIANLAGRIDVQPCDEDDAGYATLLIDGEPRYRLVLHDAEPHPG